MGGEGAMSDMNARMKSNRALLKRRSYFELKKEYLNVMRSEKMTFKMVSKKELAIVRKKIKEKHRAERKREIVILSFLFVLGLLIFWGLWVLVKDSL